MPLQKKAPFEPFKPPTDLRPEEEVFFCPLTKEIFRDYDDFFNRIILLNSLVWSCSVTGRSGLTFEEALQSEQHAQESLNSFPESLENPLLYVSTLTYRGRIDDLISDVWTFMKDRYFLNEEVEVFTDSMRRRARIARIQFHENPLHSENSTVSEQTDAQLSGKKLKEELKAPSPAHFTYDVQFLDEEDSSSSSSENSDNEQEAKEKPPTYKEGIFHSSIFRQKSNVTKGKLKLFLKNACEVIEDKWTVKPQIAQDYDLGTTLWTEIFGGPMPQFPRTPLSKRQSGVSQKLEDSAAAPSNKTEKEEKKKKKKKQPTKEQIRKMEEQRKREEEERRLAKIRERQHEELHCLVTQAKQLGVQETELSRFREIPETRMVTVDEMNDLRIVIKKAREEERERIREEKKREKEAYLEWKKPREDLLCDDLRPLPDYIPLDLPEEISPKMFGEILSLLEFFHCFKNQMNYEEPVTLKTVVEALFNQDPNGPLTDLFVILLEALSTRQDEEDGDEANLDNKEEIQCENSDLDSPLYGCWIKEATALSEKIRLTHGVSIRNLHRDASTITELIRLNLLTAGYYTGQATARFRYLQRGGYRCYDDHAFLYKMGHQETVEKLSKTSVLSLNSEERLDLLRVFADQLLTFYAFRDAEDDKLEKLKLMKNELRQLKMVEQAMEKDAKTALNRLEAEERLREMIKRREQEGAEREENLEPIEIPERPKPGKSTLKLKKLLEAVEEGGAFATFGSRGRTEKAAGSDVTDKISELLANVQFMELEASEIGEVRDLQREKFLAEEERLYQGIFDLQGSCGLGLLGRDRTFRSYWASSAVSGIFVEEYRLELGDCEEPTPLDKVPQKDPEDVPLKGYDYQAEERELRRKLMGCSGEMENCVVHGTERKKRQVWSFIGSEEAVEELVDAANPRGFRESELLENVKFLKPRLSQMAEKCGEEFVKNGRKTIPDAWKNPGSTEKGPDDLMEEAVREFIKDLEEKVCAGGVGGVNVKDRESWRESLTPGNPLNLETDSVMLDDDVVYEQEDLDKLTTVSGLAIALLQVAQGMNYKFMKLPFVEEATEVDEDTGRVTVLFGQLVPTLCFRMWQRSLLECTSLSQIALHTWTLEPAVQWKKSKLQAKCRGCRKRGNPHSLVLCCVCSVIYHLECVKPVLTTAPELWKCRDCVSSEKEKLRREQRKVREEQLRMEQNGKPHRPWKSDLFDAEMSSGSESSEASEDCGECGASVPMKLRCTCDDCSTVYHPRCVGMRGRPKTDWLCADCRPETNGVLTEEPETEPLTTQRGRVVKRKRTFDGDQILGNGQSLVKQKANSRVSSGRTTPTENGLDHGPGEPIRKKSRQRHSAIGADLSEEDIRSLSMGLRGKGGLNPDQIKICVRLIEDARRHEDAWPFMNPVDKKTPLYYEVIKTPMDLRTILNKLKGHRYESVAEVREDVRLMFENCRIFNEDGSVVSHCGKRLEDYLLKKMGETLAENFDVPVQKKMRKSF